MLVDVATVKPLSEAHPVQRLAWAFLGAMMCTSRWTNNRFALDLHMHRAQACVRNTPKAAARCALELWVSGVVFAGRCLVARTRYYCTNAQLDDGASSCCCESSGESWLLGEFEEAATDRGILVQTAWRCSPDQLLDSSRRWGLRCGTWTI